MTQQQARSRRVLGGLPFISNLRECDLQEYYCVKIKELKKYMSRCLDKSVDSVIIIIKAP